MCIYMESLSLCRVVLLCGSYSWVSADLLCGNSVSGDRPCGNRVLVFYVVVEYQVIYYVAVEREVIYSADILCGSRVWSLVKHSADILCGSRVPWQGMCYCIQQMFERRNFQAIVKFLNLTNYHSNFWTLASPLIFGRIVEATQSIFYVLYHHLLTFIMSIHNS